MAPIPQPDDPSPAPRLRNCDDQGLSVAEIASQLGVSSYRVRQALKTPTHRNGSEPVRCADCAKELAPTGATASETHSALCLPCLGKRPTTTFAQHLLAFRLAAGLSRGQVAARGRRREHHPQLRGRTLRARLAPDESPWRTCSDRPFWNPTEASSMSHNDDGMDCVSLRCEHAHSADTRHTQEWIALHCLRGNVATWQRHTPLESAAKPVIRLVVQAPERQRPGMG